MTCTMRWLAVGGLILGIVATTLGCALGGLLQALPLIDRFINRDTGDPTTRLIYRVGSSGLGNAPISGAAIKLFALQFSGNPNDPADYETVADAHRVTNTGGEAQVNVVSSPQQTEDNNVRPLTYYREVIETAGFTTYEGFRAPLGENQGPTDVVIRLVPLGP